MANEHLGSCIVAVAGVDYNNMTHLRLKRAKEEMTCSGKFTLSWPGAELSGATAMVAQELIDGAKGVIMLDGQLAATVRLDKRSSKGSPTSYTLDLSFRGLSSSLVDGSPDHKTGQENKKAPGKICKKLMEGYDSQLEDKSGEDKPLERFTIADGETVERSIRRCTTEYGLIACENEQGNVVLEKKGAQATQGHPLILGKNFTSWTTDRDIAPRASKVKCKGSSIPTEKKYGKDAEEIGAEAEDSYVKFQKILNIRVDSDHDKDSMKKRATSEQRRRQAQGLTVQLTMSTWSDDGGQLWKVGTQHMVIIPVDQISEPLVVSAIEFELSPTERKAQVTLVPKESFDDSSGSGKDSGGAGGGSTFSPSVNSKVMS